ncbi:branched chain amino acid aminotransferase [Bacteroidia bacterium]|nr:branched chain amino acid aminotransferase [Bacteroidia bacterium]
MDWSNLSFGYHPTHGNVRCCYQDGKWSAPVFNASTEITLHMAATCLHYGQEVFEGLKAYCGKDGKIRLFRVEENAKRMINSATYLKMEAPSQELFIEAVRMAVNANLDFVPPYEGGATLYIRPLLIGTSPQVGVKPASEFLFVVFVTPVGPYFKGGFQPVNVIIDRDHDRAAPLGTGHAKTGGNYAASLLSLDVSNQQGYATALYLDAREKKYVDECGPANFFGIKHNTYVTPKSHSILPSITNMSIMTLAEDMGLKVERRQVPVQELQTFEEAGECGTAAVITPIGKIFDPATDQTITYGDGKTAGAISTQLYNQLRAIQYGDAPDPHKWVTVLR